MLKKETEQKMYCVRNVKEDLYWVVADDRRLTLFENIHPIPNGVSYNAYLLMDEKTVLFDAVDWSAGRQFFENVEHVLQGRALDYLVIHHAEPDHAATVEEVLLRWPDVTVLASAAALRFLKQFGVPLEGRSVEEITDGAEKSFGRHQVTFLSAPMVHWPEVMVTYDRTDGVLFSADAFGTFGALNGKLFNDEVDFDHCWLRDARRYYTNIVGKFGPQVQALLAKAKKADIRMICPLHGPVWRTDLGYFLEKYDLWSRYEPESRGVMIAYASMYGNTESAANVLAAALADRGVKDVVLYDVSRTHVSDLIAETFRVSHIVLASVTYNLGIYPMMHNYLSDMKALNVQKRTFAILENGTWACRAGALMKAEVESLKDAVVLEPKVTITSSLNEAKRAELEALADALCADLNK